MAKRNTKAKCFISCSVSYTHTDISTMFEYMEGSLVVYMLSDMEMREKANVRLFGSCQNLKSEKGSLSSYIVTLPNAIISEKKENNCIIRKVHYNFYVIFIKKDITKVFVIPELVTKKCLSLIIH